MYTLDDVRAEYDRLDAKCNVDTKGVILKISTRGIRRYGACNYRRINSRYVPMSISLADHIFLDKNMFFHVIRHEYAHALVSLRDGKKHSHDIIWKRACVEVGCDPSRLIDARPSKQLLERQQQRVKYILTCEACGWQRYYYRRGRVVEALSHNASAYHCARCKGPLVVTKRS